MISLLALCLVIGFIADSSSLIRVKLGRYYQKEVNVTFGASKRRFTLAIDLMNQTTWITPHHDDVETLIPESTITNDNVEMLYKGNNLKGKELQASFFFDDDKANVFEHFSFYFFTSLPAAFLSHAGHLGLAFSFKDERHSIMHQYKSRGLIDHLSFSIICDYSRSYLFLGGINEENTTDKFHSSCNVNANADNWECSLSSLEIITDNETFLFDVPSIESNDTSRIVQMNLQENLIFAPPSFMEKLFMTYFNDIEQNKMCAFGEYKSTKQLYCYHRCYDDRGHMDFVIDDYVYSFTMKELWGCDIDFCYFELIANPHGEYWVFGNRFFYDKNLLFDYEEKKIHFYSNKGVGSKHSQVKVRATLWIFAAVIVIGMGVVGLLKYNLQKFLLNK